MEFRPGSQAFPDGIDDVRLSLSLVLPRLAQPGIEGHSAMYAPSSS